MFPPPPTLLPPPPENSPKKVLSSLTSSEQFALLSSYSGEKGRWCVSCESVREKRNVCINLRGCIKFELRNRTDGQSLYNEDNVSINKVNKGKLTLPGTLRMPKDETVLTRKTKAVVICLNGSIMVQKQFSVLGNPLRGDRHQFELAGQLARPASGIACYNKLLTKRLSICLVLLYRASLAAAPVPWQLHQDNKAPGHHSITLLFTKASL